jgi:hypothetical protein
MSRIIRIIIITTILAVLSIPWVWIFTHDYIALAVAFDAAVLIGVLFTRNIDEQNKLEKVEKERKLHLPTTSPVKMLQTSMNTHEASVDCAKCGLVITPMMVRKEKGTLFYHLNCYPRIYHGEASPSLGI